MLSAFSKPTFLKPRRHSHQRIKAGRKAVDLSLVTPLGRRRKKRYSHWLARCPPPQPFWRRPRCFFFFLQHSSERSIGTFGWKNVDIHSHGGPINCCTRTQHFHLKERHSFFIFTQLKTLPRPHLILRAPHCDAVHGSLLPYFHFKKCSIDAVFFILPSPSAICLLTHHLCKEQLPSASRPNILPETTSILISSLVTFWKYCL